MFGFVMAERNAMTEEEKLRYGGVYCGICRQIRDRASQTARLGLQYDMAFLALLLMSLYEPEETSGNRACMLHPVRPRAWLNNKYIEYAADMNVALAYYKSMDDYQDEHRLSAKLMAKIFGKTCPRIAQQFPRQCQAMAECISQLSALEKENCANPDLPANLFGRLMGELMVYQEDMWSENLRQLGMALGRFIYLADAATDYRQDKKKGRYNPFLSMGMEEDWEKWDQYLVMAMGRCTDYFERLPLVQDKKLLDNILYSGVWLEYRRRQRKLTGGKQ